MKSKNRKLLALLTVGILLTSNLANAATCLNEDFVPKHLPKTHVRVVQDGKEFIGYPVEDGGALLALDCLAQTQEKKLTLLGDQVQSLEAIVEDKNKQINLFETRVASDGVTITTLMTENSKIQSELDVCKINGCGPSDGSSWLRPLLYSLVGFAVGLSTGLTVGIVYLH